MLLDLPSRMFLAGSCGTPSLGSQRSAAQFIGAFLAESIAGGDGAHRGVWRYLCNVPFLHRSHYQLPQQGRALL